MTKKAYFNLYRKERLNRSLFLASFLWFTLPATIYSEGSNRIGSAVLSVIILILVAMVASKGFLPFVLKKKGIPFYALRKRFTAKKWKREDYAMLGFSAIFPFVILISLVSE